MHIPTAKSPTHGDAFIPTRHCYVPVQRCCVRRRSRTCLAHSGVNRSVRSTWRSSLRTDWKIHIESLYIICLLPYKIDMDRATPPHGNGASTTRPAAAQPVHRSIRRYQNGPSRRMSSLRDSRRTGHQDPPSSYVAMLVIGAPCSLPRLPDGRMLPTWWAALGLDVWFRSRRARGIRTETGDRP